MRGNSCAPSHRQTHSRGVKRSPPSLVPLHHQSHSKEDITHAKRILRGYDGLVRCKDSLVPHPLALLHPPNLLQGIVRSHIVPQTFVVCISRCHARWRAHSSAKLAIHNFRRYNSDFAIGGMQSPFVWPRDYRWNCACKVWKLLCPSAHKNNISRRYTCPQATFASWNSAFMLPLLPQGNRVSGNAIKCAKATWFFRVCLPCILVLDNTMIDSLSYGGHSGMHLHLLGWLWSISLLFPIVNPASTPTPTVTPTPTLTPTLVCYHCFVSARCCRS